MQAKPLLLGGACVLVRNVLNERETLDRVLQSVGLPSVENVPIWEAGNRVLAEDIVAFGRIAAIR